MRRLLALPLVAALALGACSSDSGDDEAATTTSTPAPTSMPDAELNGALLAIGDLPPGWGPSDVPFRVSEVALEERSADVPSCEGATLSLDGEGDGRTFVTYQSATGTSLSMSATFYDSSADATAAFDSLTDPQTATCATDLLGEVIGVPLTSSGFVPRAGFGDDAQSVTLTADGGLTIVLTDVLVGDAVVTWSLNGTDVAPMDEQLSQFVDQVADVASS